MLLHRREEDRDIHAIDRDARGGDHAGGEESAREVSDDRPDLPAEIREGGEPEIVCGGDGASLFVRESEDFVRQEEAHRESSRGADADLDLLREGETHQGIAQIDDEDGKGQLEIARAEA